MLLPVCGALEVFPRCSSMGDTSRIDLNLLGWPSGILRSGSGELGGEISYPEVKVTVGLS